jgi:iron complex transport system substrate-binding protein
VKRNVVFAFVAVSFVWAVVMPGVLLAPLASSYALQPTDPEVARALDYLRSAQQDDGSIGGFAVSAWVVMAIAAAGEDPHDWRTAEGNPSIVDYLRDNSSLLDTNDATEWERSILAIVAAGEDPADFGGVDYLAGLKGLYDGSQIGHSDTLNDDFWGVLALSAAGEPSNSPIIASTVDFIEAWQNDDGGWNWAVGAYSDVDDTAAAVMALVAAGRDPSSDAVAAALNYLRWQQDDSGGFASGWGEVNAASTSWAICAIWAVGENPSDWVSQSGKSPIDFLLSLQGDDGAFNWSESESRNPEFMTAYAIPALLDKPYPVTPELPPAPTPTPTEVPPTATPTPTLTPTAMPILGPAPIPTPAPTPVLIPTPTLARTATAAPTPTLAPSPPPAPALPPPPTPASTPTRTPTPQVLSEVEIPTPTVAPAEPMAAPATAVVLPSAGGGGMSPLATAWPRAVFLPLAGAALLMLAGTASVVWSLRRRA